ncbi:MAG: S8 family peptidase [Chitinophagaceae bacterium]|nr:S8 family peptidase [Chitinophagaceae bacterium]
MAKIYIALIFTLIIAASSKAQLSYTVKLKYKKSDTYSLSQPTAFLTAKAVQRRVKQHIAIDSTDLPINHAYLDSIANIPGVTIVSKSKWLNKIVVELTDPFAIDRINEFPFVDQVNITSVAVVRSDFKELKKFDLQPKTIQSSNSVLDRQGILDDTVNYGNSRDQVRIHEGEYLHNNGFRGQGMTIAVLDGGFLNYLTNTYFDSIRNNNQILGTYDFVANDSSVNEDNAHGAICFSILAANRPGLFVGTAPKANYWLFRTEDVSSEKPVEEYNWIEALEKADSLGADMISSSLGYVTFDDPQFNHSYAQRDGNTAEMTIAADLAVKKGMIVMNAAGNSGASTDENKYVFVPADGDSVMAVGAVNTSGVIGAFSSWGPNSAGKIKPNIVSVGWAASYVHPSGILFGGNGTSLANPNVAGLIACLWQAFPEFSNMEIMDAVQRSAHKFDNPDDRYGYGIPNFRLASEILEAKRVQNDSLLNTKWIKIFPNPFKQLFTVFFKAPSTGRANIRVIDLTGRVLQEQNVDVMQGNHYRLQMNPAGTKRFGMYLVQYFDGTNRTTLKIIGL